MRQLILFAFLALVLSLPLAAQTITFSPATDPIASPDRGWWEFAAEDFRTVREADLRDMRQRGLTVAYAVVRLDKFRNRPLSGGLIADLDTAFAKARRAGIKVILRFAYNYPQSSSDYDDAKDAPMNIVLGHIRQLKPVIASNADTITAFQAGFIGAWGEGHSSSNNLDSNANKARIRDALLRAVPRDIPLQWRYPADLVRWEKSNSRKRFGFHNDCFLSSPTDVGTYEGNPSQRAELRAAMAALTATTYFSGETCDADKNAIRADCSNILEEGAQFHVNALNLGYYKEFHRTWKAQGCFDEVTNKMGYRLRLDSAVIANGAFSLTVTNDGWARVPAPRKIKLRAGDDTVTFAKTLDQIGPGETVTWSVQLPPGPAPTRLCLLAPDPSPRLSRDAQFSLRFANANVSGQKWSKGMFCFEV